MRGVTLRRVLRSPWRFSPAVARRERGRSSKMQLGGVANDADASGHGSRTISASRSCMPSSGKNVFISPFSIAQALGVVYLGARGATAKAFVKSSVVPAVDPSDFACASQNLRAGLPQTDADLALEFANALWVRQGLSLKTIVRRQGEGGVWCRRHVARLQQPRRAAHDQRVGQPADAKGTFPTILNSVAGAEAIVTNAVYFKALWEEAFMPRKRAPATSWARPRTTSVPFMNQTTTFSYYAGTGFELVRLGYRGDRFAMYVVLPKQGTGLAMESTLPDAFATARANATPRRVNLHLPKLHLAYETDLVSPLTGYRSRGCILRRRRF